MHIYVQKCETKQYRLVYVTKMLMTLSLPHIIEARLHMPLFFTHHLQTLAKSLNKVGIPSTFIL